MFCLSSPQPWGGEQHTALARLCQHSAALSSSLCPVFFVCCFFCQHASVESVPSLQPSATFSTTATSASSATSSGASLPSNMNVATSLCLGGGAGSALSSGARAAPLVTSGACCRGLSCCPHGLLGVEVLSGGLPRGRLGAPHIGCPCSRPRARADMVLQQGGGHPPTGSCWPH